MLTLPGISAPMGFFDPLKFTESPTFTVSEAKRYREAEVTHCRVAMLAALGWIVAEEFHPLFNGVGGPSSFARFQAVETVFSQFWEVLLLGIGICEGFRINRAYNDPKDIDQIKDGYVPGDLGFDPLGLLPEDEDALFDLKTKELNNGRLAMVSLNIFSCFSFFFRTFERKIITHFPLFSFLICSSPSLPSLPRKMLRRTPPSGVNLWNVTMFPRKKPTCSPSKYNMMLAIVC